GVSPPVGRFKSESRLKEARRSGAELSPPQGRKAVLAAPVRSRLRDRSPAEGGGGECGNEVSANTIRQITCEAKTSFPLLAPTSLPCQRPSPAYLGRAARLPRDTNLKPFAAKDSLAVRFDLLQHRQRDVELQITLAVAVRRAALALDQDGSPSRDAVDHPHIR